MSHVIASCQHTFLFLLQVSLIAQTYGRRGQKKKMYLENTYGEGILLISYGANSIEEKTNGKYFRSDWSRSRSTTGLHRS